MAPKTISKQLITKLCQILLVLSLSCSCTRAYAEDFTLSVDKYYSPYMGANWMIAGLRGYEALDDILFSGTYGEMCPVDTFVRTGKLGLDFAVSSFAAVLQHEIFGHGARVREFHLADVSYHINLLSGTTLYSSVGFNQLNPNAQAAIAAGGVEGTSVLAQQLEQQMIASRKVDRRDAMMYLANALDQSVYIFGTSGHWFHPDNDANLYINSVNAGYGGVEALKSGNLRLKAAWDWLDPMMYLSAISIFNYMWYGDPYADFCTWWIGKMRFVPTTRLLLAPYGPEMQLKLNLHTCDCRYIGLYIRLGRTNGTNSYGLDLLVNPLGELGCFTFSNVISAWYQPHLLKNLPFQLAGNKYGFADFLHAAVQVNKFTSVWGELGYKTSGYLQGTPLAGNVVWRAGVTFSLDVKPRCAAKVCTPITFPESWSDCYSTCDS